MTNQENILSMIKNNSEWPEFVRPEHLSTLNAMADQAARSNENYGPISAILIYQQLTEEILKLLLSFSNFFVQARLWPWEIELKELRRAMFGRVIDELNKAVKFPNQNKIIEISHDINEIRIKVAHGLVKLDSIEDIKSYAIEVQSKFTDLYLLYDEADEWFRHSLKETRKSIEFHQGEQE